MSWGGLGASLGPGASKVHQVRNRVAVVASTEEEESFQSCGFKGTGNASTRQAPVISPCLGVREHGMDSDVTWRRPLPWGLILLEEPAHPSFPLLCGWKDLGIFSPDCIPPSTLNAEGRVVPGLPWLQISATWLLGGWWGVGAR